MSSKTKIVETAEWKRLRRDLIAMSARDRHVKVGILEKQGGKEKHGDSDMTVVDIAAVHEFGSPAANIPQRSFIRAPFEEKEDELGQMTRKLATAMFAGRMDIDHALDVLGQWGVNLVKRRMSTPGAITPKLAPSTIAKRKKIQKSKKGNDLPLVDTGRLMGAVTWEVS